MKLSGFSEKSDCENFTPTLPKQDLINKKLPPEILVHVISYVDNIDLQSATLVSNLWKEISIVTARNESDLIKQFVKFLIINLDKNLNKIFIERLQHVISDQTVLNSVNLRAVKSSIYKLREQILNTLKDLTKKDFECLKKVSKDKINPKFEKVFDLAEIYKEIDETNKILNPYSRELALWEISNKLSESGDIDKAIEVAKMLSNSKREFALRKISIKLSESGDINKAIKVAKMITRNTSDSIREFVLWDISKKLSESGDIDKAIKVANRINSVIKELALREISNKLSESGDIDKAIEVANMLSNCKREFALRDISIKLSESGDIDKAIEVANMIPSNSTREFVLWEISNKLSEKEKKDSLHAIPI